MEKNVRVAIVTGGATGIGLAAARSLGQDGVSVVLAGPDLEVLTTASGALRDENITVLPLRCDVSDAASVRLLVNTVESRTGRLDIVVNSAAIQPYGTVETMNEADWDRVMAVNVKGIYLVSHYAIPLIRKSGGGVIVNVGSVQGSACQTNVAAYVASKGAVSALTRAMALDHAKDGIRVNCVCPGSIDTPMLRFAASQNLGDSTEDEVIAKWGSAHPIGRVGRPEEVGAMIAFLCSSKAGFCTGGEYRIDGGLLAKVAVVLPN